MSDEIDEDWENFLSNDCIDTDDTIKNETYLKPKECTPLHISTQTKIAYLNKEIDIFNLFWKLRVNPYYKQEEGILKKMIKMTTFTKKDKEKYETMIKKEYCPMIQTIREYDNTDMKYKCIQKLSAGLSYKEVKSFKFIKEKRAFYNCIALILRVNINDIYKEFHVKVFNTGKMELPGIKNTSDIYKVLDLLIKILNNYIPEINYIKSSIYNVLINSNFNCGYCIDRDKLTHILKKKYNLVSMFDSCQYPGIQSKFYYNNMKDIQDGVCNCSVKCNKKGKGNGDGECKEVSFMIFRTGSVLIVGNCDEDEIYKIYDFLVNLFKNEHINIHLPYHEDFKNTKKKDKTKVLYYYS